MDTRNAVNDVLQCGQMEMGMPGWEEGDWRDESLCNFTQSNMLNDMGLEFFDLSHPWGLGQPCWPYFEDVKIERIHYMAKSGVLSQRITTSMICTRRRARDAAEAKSTPKFSRNVYRLDTL